MVTANEVIQSLVILGEYCNANVCENCSFNFFNTCMLQGKLPSKWSIPGTLISQAEILDAIKVTDVISSESPSETKAEDKKNE